MCKRFDLVRLAELRDAHAETVAKYRRSGEQAREAAKQAAFARADAPPLVGPAPAISRHMLPEGFTLNMPRGRTEQARNPIYWAPLSVMQQFTPDELDKLNVDHRAFSRIMAAESRLARLCAEHAQNAHAVRNSATLMGNVNRFAMEHQL